MLRELRGIKLIQLVLLGRMMLVQLVVQLMMLAAGKTVGAVVEALFPSYAGAFAASVPGASSIEPALFQTARGVPFPTAVEGAAFQEGFKA